MPFHRMNESGQKLWEGVVSAVRDKSLNLSLYLNKYVYIDAVKESPTEAKVFAVEVLEATGGIEPIIGELDNLKWYMNRDSWCRKLTSRVDRIERLIREGNFWEAHNELEDIKKKCRRLKTQINALKFPSGEGVPKTLIGGKVVREYSTKYLKTHRELAEKTFELKTKTRLVVGLGEGGTYETGIALLRNYGIPYIPGTAIKGVTKHYAVERLVEKYGTRVFNVLREESTRLETEEKEPDIFDAMEVTMLALEEEFDEKKDKPPKKFLDWEILAGGKTITVEELRQMFGTKDKEGGVVFLDALPIPPSFSDWELMEWDIMNPHYGPYYSARDKDLSKLENAPGDWHSPNPIKFLVVKPGVRFLFGLRKSKTCTGNCDDLLGKAKALLKEALKNHGVGAKTSLGYGRFE